jgi:hypothetical protein
MTQLKYNDIWENKRKYEKNFIFWWREGPGKPFGILGIKQ